MIGSNHQGFKFKKPLLSRHLEQRARKADQDAVDRRESAKVRRRADGQCEVVLDGTRCRYRGWLHVHHFLRGVGQRAIGDSRLAEFKACACPDHNSDLDLYRILPSWTTTNPQASLRFQRVA